jgi:ketopantoate reductase
VPRLSNAPQALADIEALFASAQVPVQISQDVMVDLWSKLLINCVFNAISGLAQTSYGKLAEEESIQTTQAALLHALKEAGWIDCGRLASADFKSKKHIYAAPEVAQALSKSELRRAVEDTPAAQVVNTR